MTPERGGCAVVGIGNRYRGDDGAGLAVAELLRRHAPEDVEVLTIEGDPTELLEILERDELVLVADTVSASGDLGVVYRFDATEEPIPGGLFGASTHAFGLIETIELARALGKLNAQVFVYAIAATEFVSGEFLSPMVRAEVRTVASQMLADLAWGRDLFDSRPRPAHR